MIHKTHPSEITVTFYGELDDVTEDEIQLIEAHIGDLIKVMLMRTEEEVRP